MYFGADWDAGNTVRHGPYLCGHHEEKPLPKPAPPELPAPRILTPQEKLRELHLRRVRAHPDFGGTHEAFLQANADYESYKRTLVSA